jgi:SAM-dependent methyltransferase
MGVDLHAARLLMLAKREGVDFARTVTLGHQWLHAESWDLKSLFREMRLGLAVEDLRKVERAMPYADEFIKLLGAAEVSSIDVSEYEKASIIHDMNVELPVALEKKFTLVVDCGTLEHIFDFPTAIRNCMKLLEVGGHLLTVTPANNFMGHGFYQFSPELFYRVLSPANGFQVKRMFVSEVRRCSAWYELPDPAALSQRVELTNNMPTYLLMIAKKVSDVVPFGSAPQQSDYEAGSWQSSESRNPYQGRSMSALARRITPQWLKALRHLIAMKLKPSFSASYFKRVDRRLVKSDLRK